MLIDTPRTTRAGFGSDDPGRQEGPKSGSGLELGMEISVRGETFIGRSLGNNEYEIEATKTFLNDLKEGEFLVGDVHVQKSDTPSHTALNQLMDFPDLSMPAPQDHMEGVLSAKRKFDMLVLSRKVDEKIVIGDNITLMVIDIRGDKVRLGIEAPRDIPVHRQEVKEAIDRENAANRDSDQK